MAHHHEFLFDRICPVARAMEVLGERWTFHVLREAFLGTRRFGDFQRNIGVARNILSSRLKILVEHGVLERHRYSDRPRLYEYRLTQKGLDLYPALLMLIEWSDTHMALPGGRAVHLEHKKCGQHSQPVLVCDRCGEPVRAREMRAFPGPGALHAATS